MDKSVGTASARRAGARCGGYGSRRVRSIIDIAQRGVQNEAPKKASSGTRPVDSGACAATYAAMTAARSRSVPVTRGPTPKRRGAQRVQRRSDAQRLAIEAPTVLAVLVAVRTSAAVACSYDHSDSAHAIAASEYRNPRPTPRGTTTKIAPHARHKYRRAMTSVSAGRSVAPSGPSSVRARRPWPTITSARPGSRLDAEHDAQHAGRTASHDGGQMTQDLTSTAQCTIRLLLRVFSKGARGARRVAVL